MRIRTIRDIGNAIRGRRHALGWSQADLASRAGLSRKWVSEAERGHTVVGIDPSSRCSRRWTSR